MKIGYCVFIMLILINCSQPDVDKSSLALENRIIITFPKNIELKGDVLDLDVLGIYQCFCVDSLLLTRCHGKKNRLQVYNPNSLKWLGDIFTEGKGPNEYLSLSTTGQFNTTEKGINLWLFDNYIKKIRNVNITKLIEEKTMIINKEYSYQGDSFNFYHIDSCDFIRCRYDGKNFLFSLYNGLTKESKDLFRFFQSDLSIDEISYMSGNSAIKPDLTKIAYAFMYLNQVIISTVDGKKKFSVSIGNPITKRKIEKTSRAERITFFPQIATSNNKIWLLYNATTAEQEQKGTDYQSYILVLDWDGKPLYKIATGRSLISISMDYKKDMLYGIDIDEQIIKYDTGKI